MKKKIVSGIILASIMMAHFANICMADSVEQKRIDIWAYSWSECDANKVSRTGNSAYAYARNHAVFPDNGGTDNYKKIQCRIVNDYDLQISNTTILNETSTKNTNIKIYDGYLNMKTANFEFKGNSDKNAIAIVSYGSN